MANPAVLNVSNNLLDELAYHWNLAVYQGNADLQKGLPKSPGQKPDFDIEMLPPLGGAPDNPNINVPNPVGPVIPDFTKLPGAFLDAWRATQGTFLVNLLFVGLGMILVYVLVTGQNPVEQVVRITGGGISDKVNKVAASAVSKL